MSAGIELSVGKGPGPALAELYVALGVQLACAVEALYALFARQGVLSALRDDGAHAGSRQHQRREHPRRAEAHDQRPLLRLADAGYDVLGRGIDRDVRAFRTGRRPLLAAGDGDAHGVNVSDIVLFARVERAL